MEDCLGCTLNPACIVLLFQGGCTHGAGVQVAGCEGPQPPAIDVRRPLEVESDLSELRTGKMTEQWFTRYSCF